MPPDPFADQFLSRFGPYRLQPYPGGADPYSTAAQPPVGFSPVPFPTAPAPAAPATGLPTGLAGLPGADPGGMRAGDRTPNGAPSQPFSWGGMGDALLNALKVFSPLGLGTFGLDMIQQDLASKAGQRSATGGMGITPAPLAPGMQYSNPSMPGLMTPGAQVPSLEAALAAAVAAGQMSSGNARLTQQARNTARSVASSMAGVSGRTMGGGGAAPARDPRLGASSAGSFGGPR